MSRRHVREPWMPQLTYGQLVLLVVLMLAAMWVAGHPRPGDAEATERAAAYLAGAR